MIDFGGMGVGDPACDLQVAWNFLTAESRLTLRAALREQRAPCADEASWARGRGWALSVALLQLPYYLDTNPTLANSARRTIAEVLADTVSNNA